VLVIVVLVLLFLFRDQLGFGADKTDQRDQADPRARRKNGVGGEGGVCRGDEERGREQASNQGHEYSIRLQESRSEIDRLRPLGLDSPLGRAAFSGFAVPATGSPRLRSCGLVARGPASAHPEVQAMFSCLRELSADH